MREKLMLPNAHDSGLGERQPPSPCAAEGFERVLQPSDVLRSNARRLLRLHVLMKTARQTRVAQIGWFAPDAVRVHREVHATVMSEVRMAWR